MCGRLRVNVKNPCDPGHITACHFKNDLATVFLRCVIINTNNGDPAGINYLSNASQNLKANQGFFSFQPIHKYMSRVF